MTLSPIQRQAANVIYGLGINAGLTPARALELVSAAYAESDLNPNATNKSSGAAGPFQLLSSGYRQTAQKLGGLYDTSANTRAILPDYLSYWKTHPGAAPGEGGAAVERSGMGAGFYANPLSLLRSQGIGGVGNGSLAAPGPRRSAPPPSLAPDAPPATAGPDYRKLALALLNSNNGANDPAFYGALRQTRQAQLALPARQPAAQPIAPRQPVTGTSAPAGRPGQLLGFPTKVIGVPYQGSHTLYGNWQSDNAIDLAAPVGTPIYAPRAGTIGSRIGALGSQDPHLTGLRLTLTGGGNSFYLAHLSRLAVKAGQRVKAGQLLGYSGSANGVAHLHIATEFNDPRKVLALR